MDFKKNLFRLGKMIILFIEFFFLFICFYFALVLWGLSISTGSFDEHGNIDVYVRSNGVHTDLCIPLKQNKTDWTSFFDLNDFKDSTPKEYVAIGWGDKGFFLDTPTWAELKASTAMQAIFIPSSTAMHIEFIDEPKCSETCVKTKVSRKSYKKMVAFIKRSFSRDNGEIQLISGHSYGSNDNFYEANGSYHLFKTCNIWTNNVLKEGDVPTSLYSLHPLGNLRYLKEGE